MFILVFLENDLISYNSTVFLIKCSLVSVYFSAGLTKARLLGLEWFQPTAFEKFILANRARFDKNYFIDFNYYTLKYFSISKYFYFLTLPIELISPLGVLKKFKFVIYILALFQISVALILYANFYEYIGVFLICLTSKPIPISKSTLKS